MDPTLDQLKSDYAELGSITVRQEQRVRYYEAATIKLVVAYIILQTLIFLSVSHSNSLCKTWWIPCCLSSLIAVIFAIPFKRFVRKWERTDYYYDMQFMDQELIHHNMQVMMFQGRVVEDASSNITIHTRDESNRKIVQPDVRKQYQRNACIYLVTAALIAYTTVVLIACRSGLCHRH